MKQKLIKLSETHYIIVDDSEIKEGDCGLHNNKTYREKYINIDKHIIVKCTKSNEASIQEHWDKITYSTQPLNESTQPNTEFYWNNIGKLSLSEVEELINGYSVEKIALRYEKSFGKSSYGTESIDYTEGFNAHKQLVKDKFILTKEQLENALFNALNYKDSECCVTHTKDSIVRGIIKSLLPKTEWNVEFVNGKLKLI